MAADVLTTWGVVLDLDPAGGGERGTSAASVFAEGRRAYFDRCPRLASFLRAEDAELRPAAEHVDGIDDAAWTGGFRIGVSVVEVRPSSFTMALRIRRPGEGAGASANGRCTVVIERRVTGERIAIPPEVRDEFIAIQLGARDLC
jgi:acyl-CoA thioesterase FadM